MNKEDKIKTIWVLYGIQASGKSTWAKGELMRYPGKYKRVNKDLLRLMLDNDKFDFENEKFVLKVRDNIVESSLRKGYDVIVDDTNFPIGGKHFKRMCEIAQKVGNVRVIEKYFDISLKEALQRNKNSDRNPVPEDVIKNTYEKHVKNKSSACQDLFFQKVEKIPLYKPNLPECVIFDIDGTLAHMNGRGAYEWDKVGSDLVDENIRKINHIIAYYAAGDLNIKVFIFTGRDGVAFEETEKWLKSNQIHYDEIFIKGKNDNRKDTIVKKEYYDNYIKDKYNVIVWIDDRNSIVDMARTLGITVLQCNYGDF